MILLLWKMGKLKLQITNHELRIMVLAIVFFIFALLMILSISKPIYETFTILKKFQFPWRWLSLVILPPAVIGGYLIRILPKKYFLFAVSFLVFTVLLLTFNMWKVKNYDYSPDSYYVNEYQGSTDASGENSPIWSIRFMEAKPKANVEVVEGEGKVLESKHSSILHEYEITAIDDKVRVLDNTLYFPGWNVYVDRNKLSLRDVWWQDPNYRGLITFFVEKGHHEIIVKFERTKIRLLAEIISLVSIGLLVSLPMFSKVLWPKK